MLYFLIDDITFLIRFYIFLGGFQNQVFGAGYKSLPTMTQDEYFEKEIREGKIVMDYE